MCHCGKCGKVIGNYTKTGLCISCVKLKDVLSYNALHAWVRNNIKAKDARKKSQLLRGVLWREWQNSKENCEAEVYYEREMNKIIQSRIENR